MFCPNCGSNNFNNGYCPNCGYNLNQVQKPSKKTNIIPFIVIGFIVIAVIVVLLFVLGKGNKDKYVGNWECKGYTSSSGESKDYMVSMELNSDNTYRFGKYNDLDKNHFKGTYTSSYEDDKKTKYNKDFYIINFKVDEFINDGVNQNQTGNMEFEMEFINDKETLIINSSTLSMYYCYKK